MNFQQIDEKEVSLITGTTPASYDAYGKPIRKFTLSGEVPTTDPITGKIVTGPARRSLTSQDITLQDIIVAGAAICGGAVIYFLPWETASTVLVSGGILATAVTVTFALASVIESTSSKGVYIPPNRYPPYHERTYDEVMADIEKEKLKLEKFSKRSAEAKKTGLSEDAKIEADMISSHCRWMIESLQRELDKVKYREKDYEKWTKYAQDAAAAKKAAHAAAAATTCLYRSDRSNKKEVGTEFKKKVGTEFKEKASPCKQPELIVKSQEEPKRAPSGNRTVYTYSKRHDGTQTVKYH